MLIRQTIISTNHHIQKLKQKEFDISEDDIKFIIELMVMHLPFINNGTMNRDNVLLSIAKRVNLSKIMSMSEPEKFLMLLKDIMEDISFELDSLSINKENLNFKRWAGNDILIEH